MTYIKIFAGKPVRDEGSEVDGVLADLENEVNDWIDEAKARGAAFSLSVLYKRPVVVLTYETDKQTSRARPELPRLAGSTVPTRKAEMTDENGARVAHVMAGICGVPEGFKLHPGDTEPAPPPILPVACDLTKYANYLSGGQNT